MLHLPKGTPLFENLDASKLQLDTITTKLSRGCFTGYASFTFPEALGLLAYKSGWLISAVFENSLSARMNDLDALAALADQMLVCAESRLHIYRLSDELSMCVHSLLQGEPLYDSQELALVDVRDLLERIRNEQMNCCISVYNQNCSTMIFYKEGSPLGFFHDGSQELETSADSSQQLIQDPLTRLALYTTVSSGIRPLSDLLDGSSAETIWNLAVIRHQNKT